MITKEFLSEIYRSVDIGCEKFREETERRNLDSFIRDMPVRFFENEVLNAIKTNTYYDPESVEIEELIFKPWASKDYILVKRYELLELSYNWHLFEIDREILKKYVPECRMFSFVGIRFKITFRDYLEDIFYTHNFKN